MKKHHALFALCLLSTGFSTNVVYQYQSEQGLFRSIASDKVEITMENILSEVEQLKESAESMKSDRDEIKAYLEGEKSEQKLESLLSLRDDKFKNIRETVLKNRKVRKAIKVFIDENQGEIKEEVQKGLQGYLDGLNSSELVEISLKLENSIEKALERKAVAQEKQLDELSASICEQNRTLSSLTSKIESLIQDKKNVISEVKDNTATSVDKTPSALELLMAFQRPYAMDAANFFNAPAPIGLQSEANPLGLDMNFLMMTQMLTNSSGFGPRANINYAPVYHQNRNYNGMPSMMNFGSDMANPFSNQVQNRGPLQGIESGFNFVPQFQRGNVTPTEISLLGPVQ